MALCCLARGVGRRRARGEGSEFRLFLALKRKPRREELGARGEVYRFRVEVSVSGEGQGPGSGRRWVLSSGLGSGAAQPRAWRTHLYRKAGVLGPDLNGLGRVVRAAAQ